MLEAARPRLTGKVMDTAAGVLTTSFTVRP